MRQRRREGRRKARKEEGATKCSSVSQNKKQATLQMTSIVV